MSLSRESFSIQPPGVTRNLATFYVTTSAMNADMKPIMEVASKGTPGLLGAKRPIVIKPLNLTRLVSTIAMKCDNYMATTQNSRSIYEDLVGSNSKKKPSYHKTALSQSPNIPLKNNTISDFSS